MQAAQAKVVQAQASVEEAQAQLARLNRVKELSGGKMPSQTDLDAAKANLARYRADEASAKASVAQAQAALNVNRTDLTKAVITSQINGVVLKRSVEPGQTVAATFQSPTLFTLAEDLTQMELQVYVDEADVGQVREGQEATFTVDAYPDRTFPVRITHRTVVAHCIGSAWRGQINLVARNSGDQGRRDTIDHLGDPPGA